MHSRIFVYNKGNKVAKSKVFEHSFIEHWFIDNIADYVINSNLHEDIKWLKATFHDLPILVDDKNNFIIANNNEFKNKYFNSKYYNFSNLLSEMKNSITLDKFSYRDITTLNKLWQLNNLYNDTYSFYFCDEDMQMLTMDEFIREMELNCKYFISKTFDYHF